MPDFEESSVATPVARNEAARSGAATERTEEGGGAGPTISAPAISLPKGGGALRGIDEKLSVNPATGTASLSVPLFTSPGRQGVQPALSLAYDSGAGNGVFGLGWSLSMPSVTRKTAKGLPRYQGRGTFILSGAEDLVPVPAEENDNSSSAGDYRVRRYRPRIEGLFARIERWQHKATGAVHWRSVSKDNVTSVYGRTAQARIADPNDPTRVFQWLIEETRDAKGNVIQYEYKQENADGVEASSMWERHRLAAGRFANRYPKRIRYGNTLPYQPRRDAFDEQAWERGNQWLFEVVFDYGEHDEAFPQPAPSGSWPVRKDPFSSYKAGFEIRTYRLCWRVLMFHRFSELGDAPHLVRSTDLAYEPSPVLTYLTGATQVGYIKKEGQQAYAKKALPPVTFDYAAFTLNETVETLDAESLEHLPAGLDGQQYRWVDLYGEGLSGVLTQQGSAWYYKRNEGDGALASAEPVAALPSLADLNGGRQRLMDLAGDGRLDLVQFDGGVSGFYERDGDRGWTSFVPFRSMPNIDWQDPHLRLVDLTGDGRADALISEEDVFTFYAAQGEDGFAPAERAAKALDEEHGPPLVFADAAQSIYLADLSGDGLADIVRIRNGAVCYWPNLGYGRFGAKVTMGGAPHFDHAGSFSQRRIRLADIDGSGTTDILYLGRDAVRIWLNQAGNRFSAPRELHAFPEVDNVASVQVLDLLGTGTACLVWSSPLPAHTARPVAYIDLMGGQKPHLLTTARNNMGKETQLRYAPSTKFYLEDRAAGRPWKTKLPFPVHVVERVETREHVSDARYVTRYSYHHGYFDGTEREFRGFGLVEQWDAEHLSESLPEDDVLHRPPVYTKTWFHTGAYLDREALAHAFRDEYYAGDPDAKLLPNTSLPPGLTTEEARQACRALKGRMLRQEIYAEDETPEQTHPYRVVENAYRLQMLQPAQDEQDAVFYAYRSASLSYAYERDPGDPRISHQLTLAVDDFGNVTQSVQVAYPRRATDAHPEQQETHLLYTEADVINVPDELDFYRIGVPWERRTYEVTGLLPEDAIFAVETLRSGVENAADIPFEDTPDGTAQKRLIKRTRTRYLRDDRSGLLAWGEVEALALPFESYQMAFTPGLLTQVYNSRVDATMLDASGYVQADGVWWARSGRQTFAADQFYRPVQYTDPFGADYTTVYDRYALLIEETRDALGDPNVVRAENNYRTLQPEQVTGPNGNRSAAYADALGRVVATAVMGKVAAPQGDTLDGFQEIEPADIPAAVADPHRFLQEATTRVFTDLDRFQREQQPISVHAISRETHAANLSDGEQTKVQHSITYLDGLGREVMTKAQAEPGEAHAVNGEGRLTTVDTTPGPRWVGTGRTVYDNKGKPVKQYEPYFSVTPAFEDEDELVRWGVTPVMRYDPLGRLIRTDAPDGTLSRVEFTPWEQLSWDAVDTVTESAWLAERQDPAADPRERRAATQSARHADTPSLAHLDTLGRTVLTVADNGSGEKYPTHLTLDVQGHPLVVTDALDRPVMTYRYDLLGRTLFTKSMDAGERWMLPDVTGQPMQQWDSRGHRIETRYDVLRRPVEVWMQQEDSSVPVLVEKTVYGETHPDARARNLRGRVHQQFDGAGVVTFADYDFKGNLLRSRRQLAETYDQILDWSAAPALEAASFAKETTYDALDRPQELTMPDASRIRLAYNEAGLLGSVEAQLRGATATTVFVRNIDYNARGQRTRIAYANGASTRYTYDDETFRLARLRTTRASDDAALQDLQYTYDPVGNITEITDDAQQDVFFRNGVASPNAKYEYDALYRLTKAEGREQARAASNRQPTADELPHANLPHPNDAQAVHRYEKTYDYDAVGNVLQMAHRALNSNAASLDWTRRYQYEAASNRLRSTSRPGDAPLAEDNAGGMYSARYTHDAHGNMTAMPHLPALRWDFGDQLREVDLGGGGTVYYVYGADGQRVRKVHEHSGATVEERLYLGGFEVYRKRRGGALEVRRETLHLMDDTRRIALVETKTHADGAALDAPVPVVRYQLGNHLGSASLELDENAQVITYEEYFPFGGTAYRAGRSAAETSLKRYRYTGKERDDETGLYYYGARYYAAWLGRWTAADPAGLVDGLNIFRYGRNNPLKYIDPQGTDSGLPSWDEVRKEASDAYQASKDVATGMEEAMEEEVVETGKGLYEAATDPVGTAKKTYEAMGETYEKAGGGVEGAYEVAMEFNPALDVMKAGYEGAEALERGDYKEVGRQIVKGGSGVVDTVGTAMGGAGLAKKGVKKLSKMDKKSSSDGGGDGSGDGSGDDSGDGGNGDKKKEVKLLPAPKIGISKQRAEHIISGNRIGGAHAARYDLGGKKGPDGPNQFEIKKKPKKTYFDPDVTDQEILDGVARIANDPASYPKGIVPAGKKLKSRYEAVGWVGEQKVKVIVEPRGEGVITAFPTGKRR